MDYREKNRMNLKRKPKTLYGKVPTETLTNHMKHEWPKAYYVLHESVLLHRSSRVKS